MRRGTQLPIFFCSIAVVAGIVSAAYLPFSFLLPVGGVLLGGVLLARRRMLALCLVVALCAGGYFQLYDGRHASTLNRYADGSTAVQLSGVIATAPERDGDNVRFFLEVEAYRAGDEQGVLSPPERVACRIKLTRVEQVPQAAQWRSGQRLTATVTLQLPDGARNPHAFDYARYLRWQGVSVMAQGDFARTWVEVDKYTLKGWFETWQQQLAERLERLFPAPDIAGYMKSLLLGLDEEVEPGLAEMYADLGLLHVLAISGLHVTLVSGGFLWLLERIGVRREHALVAACLFIAAYVLLVGASPSAVRAGLMGAIGLLAVRFRRNLDIREGWGIALILMLFADPYQLWQVGFQLSFCVTLGLIIYVPLLTQFVVPRIRWLSSAIAVATAAAVVSFPFLIFWFHQFSPLSWLLNLLVVPVLSLVVLPAGYIALFFTFLYPAMGALLAQATSLFLTKLHDVLAWLNALPIPFSAWPHPHRWWLVAYAGWLIAVPLLWQRGYQRGRDITGYAIVFCLLLIAARQPLSGLDEVRVTFLDVGQGDSIVVEVAGKTVYLIDGGGIVPFTQTEPWRKKKDPFDPGDDIVVPYLRSRGIERIDRLVVTHGDQDHIGGLYAVAARIPVAAALLGGAPPPRGDRELLQVLKKRGVPLYYGEPGVSWEDAPGVRWTWLSPAAGGISGAGDANDNSVVLLLAAYGKRVLFTGDIERTAEEQLLQNDVPYLSTIDVLKVAHHGSKTSTTASFLARTRPRVAVISVGRNNRYGHPSADVLARLEQAGVAVLRTDRDGAITLTLRPDGWEWQTQNRNGLQPFRAASRQ